MCAPNCSRDPAAIVHFNWVKGHQTKAQLLAGAGMWLLGPDGECADRPA
jgi:hypothetical protein